MKNYQGEGKSITITAPVGGVTAGEPVVIGALIGVAKDTAIAGADVVVETEGVFAFAAESAIAVGTVVEFTGGYAVAVDQGDAFGVVVKSTAASAHVKLLPVQAS